MDKEFLHKALDQAKRGRGFCAPNPAVGAVVVKDAAVVAEGFHTGAGAPHAEVEALRGLSEELCTGATVYVTLEPCCHWGKTPPCTDFLIQKKVGRVVFAFEDPNPQVRGKGRAALEAAGIDVTVMPTEAITDFYECYAFWVRTGRPFVTAKLAMSLNGKIAGLHGLPVQLSSDRASLFTHEGRRASDAILTTAKTVIQDDPLLTCRLPQGETRKPIYILDRRLETPLTARLFRNASQVTLFFGNDVPQERVHHYQRKGVRCLNAELYSEILGLIGKDGVHDLWVEAGGHTFGRMAAGGYLQRAYLYLCPTWLPEGCPSAFEEDAVSWGAKVKEFRWSPLDPDGLCTLRW